MGERILTSEIQSLERSATVELFTLDATRMGGNVLHFHSGVNNNGRPIVWQGVTYQPLPIESDGYDISSQGSLPTPKIRLANVQGLFSALAMELDNLIGARLIRHRTFGRFLDAVNFPSGNPEADPTQHHPDELWFIDRKVSETRFLIEWEFASAFDLMGVQLPYGQIMKYACRWRYRSAECGWTGGYFDEDDKPTSDNAKDRCAKRISSCECRFGDDAELPYGGYPGAQQ